MNDELKYEVKKGIQVLWVLSAYIVFVITIFCIIYSKTLYDGWIVQIISYVIIALFVIMGILNRFGFSNEVIKAYENKVIYINKHQEEKQYLWEEILYKKEKKYHAIPTGKYSRIYRIKVEYSFYKDEQMLFSVTDIDSKAFVDFIEELISLKRLNKKQTVFNNEEVLEVKTNNSNRISIALEIIGLAIFGLIYLFVVFFTPFKGTWFLMLMYIVIVLFSINYYRREFKQLQQAVYVVKEKGFYILKNNETKFYKFNEIDKVETECYITPETVDNKLTIYKDNKELIVLTNSNSGFYEFLDILKERNLIKE